MIGLALVFSAVGTHELSAQLPVISLSSTTPNLVIREALAGSVLLPESDNSTRVTLTTTGPSSLFASLDAPLPNNVALRVRVDAPVGAVSMGFVTLDSTPQAVVSGIAPGIYPALTVTYELVALPGAGTISQTSCNVLFTLETGS
jgi:hypothetical protein